MADGRARRRDDPRLHVGHDRPAEGGDAHQRQRRLRRSTASSGCPSACPTARCPTTDDFIVTYLPLCHIAERVFSTWHMVACGCVLNFAESIETITANLREVQPTLFFAVPRIWEQIHGGVYIRANDATWLKRKSLGFGMRLARSIGRAKVANGGVAHRSRAGRSTPSASRSCCAR